MRRKLALIGALAGLFLASAVWAQSVIQDNLSGNEAWNAGQGPGGPTTGFITSNLVRNSKAAVVTTLTTSITYGTTPLGTLSEGGLVLVTSQPLVVTTLTAMANPVTNGAEIGVCNVTGSAFATTAINIAANSGQTLNTTFAVNNLGATTCARYLFNRSETKWYRIQ